MDNFDINKMPPPQKPDDEPIPFDNDESTDSVKISNKPLSLGNESKAAASPRPTAKLEQKTVSSGTSDRITGVRTFFTKLHAGAIEFLDEQINDWLKNNPGIIIKRTNTVTGVVQGKKDEPSIIITIWY